MAIEAELQKKCNKALRDAGMLFIHLEKGARRNRTHRRDIPDLIFGYGGRIYAVELKAPGKKPSPEQLIWLDRFFDEWGGWVFYFDNYEDFMGLLKEVIDGGIHEKLLRKTRIS